MIPLLVGGAALVGFMLGRKTAVSSTSVVPPKAKNPLLAITMGQWEKFVATMAVAPKEHVGRRGRLGAFQMDARRLADVGAMTRAWKDRRGDENGVWVGHWCEGLSEPLFLGNMPVQYATFVRSMRGLAPKVVGLVGAEVDRVPASLSGLLGVGHIAGEKGVEGFVKDEAVRKKFPATREMFVRTNQIF